MFRVYEGEAKREIMRRGDDAGADGGCAGCCIEVSFSACRSLVSPQRVGYRSEMRMRERGTAEKRESGG